MTTLIRLAERSDFDAILAINNAAVPDVSELTEVTLDRLANQAAYFRVAERNGEIAGFIICLTPGADYASSNYRWFLQHYDEFVYIDRVVVAERHRGHGVGNIIYADVHSFAEQVAPRLTCEVHLNPYNKVSLLFHIAHGFKEVGQQIVDADSKKVGLFARVLHDYEYVQDTYG